LLSDLLPIGAMMDLSEIDLSRAEESFGISQAPLFLTRRLQSDPMIQTLSKNVDPDQILKALADYLSRRPTSLRDAARPYAYLVALSFLDDDKYIRLASAMDAPFHEWFHYITRVLQQTKKPSSRTFIPMNPGHFVSVPIGRQGKGFSNFRF
jgi:hypothetical protein